MSKVMSYLNFAFYLFGNGRFVRAKIDFDRQRKKSLANLPEGTVPAGKTSTSISVMIKSIALTNPYFYYLAANLTEIKNRHRVHKQFFIIEREKLIYLRLYKNASTSILNSMLPIIRQPLQNISLNDMQIDSLAPLFVKKKLLPRHLEFTCFTIVRNPFERIVSAYLDIFKSGDAYFSYETFLFGLFSKELTFKEFIKKLRNVPDELRGPHFTSQMHAINCAKIGQELKVFRLEHDYTELLSFLNFYGISIGHHNRSPVKYDYADYYDDEIIDMVSAIYKIDLDAFGYAEAFENLKQRIKIKSLPK